MLPMKLRHNFALLLGLLLILPSLAFALTQEIPEQNILLGTSSTHYGSYACPWKNDPTYTNYNWINPKAIYYRVLINPDGSQEFLDMYHFYNYAIEKNMVFKSITLYSDGRTSTTWNPENPSPTAPIYQTKTVAPGGADSCGAADSSAPYNRFVP